MACKMAVDNPAVLFRRPAVIQKPRKKVFTNKHNMVLSKVAILSTFLASASLVAGHGFVSSILANGQK